MLLFDRPLLPGRLIKRYKRFLADIELASGELAIAHCANSGAMTTCAMPDSPILVSEASNLTRKLRFTWEMIAVEDTWVGVNTNRPNEATFHFIAQGMVPELAGYPLARREVRYGIDGCSRIDILLEDLDRPPCYVEVKNTTMRRGEHAAFPDAVTLRGQKHLRELSHLAQNGTRAVMFFFMGRSDCRRFRPADEVDPAYGVLLRQAVAAGVELLAYRFEYTPAGVQLLERAPVDL